MLGHSKWGVAWELGSSLGVGEGSANVRQRMSALDHPGQKKFGVRASFFKSSFINTIVQVSISTDYSIRILLICFVRSHEIC